MFHISPHSS